MRLRSYRLLVATLLAVSIATATTNETLAGEPSTPLGDRPPQKTGLIPDLAMAAAPRVVWRYVSQPDDRGEPVGVSDAATADGMLFFGDDQGVVRAVTAREGIPIWTHDHGERVYFPPTCDGERLYFTTRKGLTAIESESGILLWNRPVKHSVGRCVVWQPTETVYFSDSEGQLHAVDAVTGEKKWSADFGRDAPPDPPGFDGERARFERTIARPSGIATDGKQVFQSVFDQCRVVAFDCQTGKRTATFQTQGWILGDPAIDGDRLFVGSQDEHLYCFDSTTGRVLWKHKTGGRIESGPGISGDRVVVGSCNGRVHCCDRESGRLLWTFAIENPQPIYSAPIVTNDSVYIAMGDGTLYAFNVETGAVRWQLRPVEGSRLFSSPATDGTRIFVTSQPLNDSSGVDAIVALGPDE